MVTIAVPPRTGNYGPEDDGAGGVLRVGLDQVLKSQTLTTTVAPAVMLSDPGPPSVPLKVVLPKCTPGNWVRVSWKLDAIDAQVEEGTFPASVSAQAAVSFDGTTTFPGTFSYVNNSAGGASVDVAAGECSMTGLAMFQVPENPDPAVPAGTPRDVTALLIYQVAFDVSIVGTDLGALEALGAVTLQLEELGSAIVAQGGPGSLVPVGP